MLTGEKLWFAVCSVASPLTADRVHSSDRLSLPDNQTSRLLLQVKLIASGGSKLGGTNRYLIFPGFQLSTTTTARPGLRSTKAVNWASIEKGWFEEVLAAQRSSSEYNRKVFF